MLKGTKNIHIGKNGFIMKKIGAKLIIILIVDAKTTQSTLYKMLKYVFFNLLENVANVPNKRLAATIAQMTLNIKTSYKIRCKLGTRLKLTNSVPGSIRCQVPDSN